jgi:hypothetical protein
MQIRGISEENEALIREYLDIVEGDSENLERTMDLMSDECVWVMEPTGDTYEGREEIRAFIDASMLGRTHDDRYSIQIIDWFATNERLCIEYTHGAVLAGTWSAGLKGKIEKGVLRYCITYHMREGKFDTVREYIQGTTPIANFLLPAVLRRVRRLATKALAKEGI